LHPRRHIDHDGSRSRDAGDTLVELLVALVIISICVVGLIGGLASAIGSAGNHRNLTNLDSAMKDFAEVVRYDVQLQPLTSTSAPLYARCASRYLLAGTPNPSSGPVGTAVTSFGSGFSGSGSSSVSMGSTIPPNSSVALTDPVNGNVTANFTVPPLPAGTYPITISDGGTATSTTGYTVTPWIGGLSRTSGPVLTQVTSSVTGFAAGKLLTVTVGTAAPVSGGAVPTNSSGSGPLSFRIPTGLPPGLQTVVISDGANSARTTFTVGATLGPPGVGGPIVSSSPLAGYKVGISGIGYWDGTSFSATQAQCLAKSGSNNDIQQINISGSAPGATDQLNTVVSNPLFVPTPTVQVSQDATSNPQIGGALILDALVSGPQGGSDPSIATPGVTPTITWLIDVAGTQLAPTCAGAGQLNGNPDPKLLTPAAGPLPAASAQCVIYGANLTANNYTVTAIYNGNTSYNSASGTYQVTIPKALQTILVQAPSPPPYNQPVIFTATVSVPAGGPAPQGTVTWTLTGPATTCDSTTPLTTTAPYTATCQVNHATVGTYYASASVSADANYNANSSGTPQSVTVPHILTTTSVVALPSSPTLGGPIQFTATVTGSGGPSLTGTVTWSLTLSGAATACDSTTPLTTTAPYTATCIINHALAGNYTATASYSGDSLYANSTGSSPAVVVSLATPNVTVSGAAAGGNVTFTATVAGPAGGATPTGAGTWTVTGAATTCTGVPPTTPLTGTGNPPGTATATCLISKANAGTYNVSYSYGGDSNYNPASGSTSYTVNPVTPSVAITAVMHAHQLTFTSTVTGTGGGPTPTGTGTWTVSGPKNSCTGNTTPLTGTGNPQGTATATCVVSSPAPAGDYTVTYAYPGDNNYNAASGNNLFHVPSLVLIHNINGNGKNETLTFTATLNISPGVPAPNGTVKWAISGAAASCTGGTTPLTSAGSQTTYTATCTILNSNNNTYNATATFGLDTYYLPADDSLSGVAG
jgi:type II secretory pathway pseudopilin PulG